MIEQNIKNQIGVGEGKKKKNFFSSLSGPKFIKNIFICSIVFLSIFSFFGNASKVSAYVLTISKLGTGTGTVGGSGGINCGSTCSAEVGTSTIINAVADGGSVFAGYTGSGCSSASSCTVNLSSNVTLYAIFSIPIAQTASISTTSVQYTGSLVTRAVTCSGGGTPTPASVTGTNVGTYTATISCAAYGSYGLTSGLNPGSFSITAVPQTASINTASYVYNGTLVTRAVTCSGGGTPTPASVTGTNVGTYTATISCGAIGNYALTGSLNPGSFTITGVAQTASIVTTSAPYTGSAIVRAITCSGGGTPTPSSVSGTNAGSYSGTAISCSATGNYALTSGLTTSSFTITPSLTQTASFTDSSSVTYTGSAIVRAVTCLGGGTASPASFSNTNVGTYSGTAISCPANGNYIATSSLTTTNSYSITGVAQTASIVTTSAPYTGSAIVRAITCSGGGTPTPSSVSGTNAGSYSGTAISCSATGNYALTSGLTTLPFTITASLSQTASLSPTSVVYNGSSQSATVSCSGGGTPSPATVSGTNVGSYTATITCGTNGNYISTGSLNPGNLSITGIAQTASITNTPIAYNGTVKTATILCSGGGAGTVATGGTGTTVGSYATTANCAATGNYATSNGISAGNFVIAQGPQATLTASATTGPWSGSITVSASGGSTAGTKTFYTSNNTASGCSIVSSTGVLTATSAGTCNVYATMAGNTNYLLATSATISATFTARAQTALTITSTTATYGSVLALTTSGGGSSATDTFVVNSGSCTVAGTNLTPTGAGTCTITATSPADSNYTVISSSATAITIGKGTPTALTLVTSSGTYPGFTVTSTGGASNTSATTYSVTNGTGVGCVINSSTGALTVTSAGTCNVTLGKVTDANWLAATGSGTATVNKASQSGPLTLTSTSGTYNTPLNLVTTGGSSSAADTYTVVNGTATGCAIGGTTPNFTLISTSTGTCSVTPTSPTDVNYLVLVGSATTVTLGKATPTALTLVTSSGTYPGFTVTSTGGVGNTSPTTYSTTNGTATGCSINSSTGSLTVTTVGTCNITMNEITDTNWLAATGSGTATVSKATPTALTLVTSSGTYPGFTVTSTGGASNTSATTYSVTNGTATGCSINSSTGALTVTTVGTCNITMNKITDTNWLAATGSGTATVGQSTIVSVGAPTGTTTVGSLLTSGTVSPAGASVNYQWQSDVSGNSVFSNISGATSSTYTLTNSELGDNMKICVSGTGNYTGTVCSTSVGVVTTPVTAISDITGSTIYGSVLTAGTLTPSGANVSYQWKSSTTSGGTYTNISGATSSTYTLVSTDIGDYLKVVVTGISPYTSSVTSNVTTVVLAKQLTIANPTLTLSKVYDGTTSAVVTPGALSGKVGADVVSINTTVANYDSLAVGINKTITVVYTLTGANASNYLAPANYVVSNGIITARQLTIGAPTITLSKVYDGTTSAVVTPGLLMGVQGIDPISINTAIATYDTAAVGTSKTITVVYTIQGGPVSYYLAPVNSTDVRGIITDNTLTVSKTGTGTGTITTNVGGINCGVTCTNLYTNGTSVTLTATPDATSNFVSWSGDADCTDGVVSMAGSKTCTATFTLKTYALTINASTGTGSGSYGGTTAGTYNHGTAVSVTATPVANSVFASWYATGAASACNGTTTSPCAFSLTSAAALNAIYNLNLFTITFNINGGNGGSTASQSLVYNTPTALRTNGFTRTGYVFDGWATSGGGAMVYTDGANYTIGAADVTLYAHWIPNNNLVIFNINGGDSGSMSNQTIATDASANLTPNAFTYLGHHFVSWNTASNGSGTTYNDGVSYTMGSNSSYILYAQWSINTYLLTTTKSGGLVGSISSSLGGISGCTTSCVSSPIDWNSTVAVTGTAVPGYAIKFTGCTLDTGGGLGNSASCSFNFRTPTTITVTYVAPPTVVTSSASSITMISAQDGGSIVNIADLGYENNDERGIVYDTTSHPTNPGNVAPTSTAYSVITLKDIGTFSSNGSFGYTINGLTESTTYYVRAYSHNTTGGYSYGNEVPFTTLAFPMVEQSAYKIFSNTNNLSSDIALSSQNTPITLDGLNTPFQLKMLLHLNAAGTSLPSSAGRFKLQYAPKTPTCTIYSDITADTPIAFYNNTHIDPATVSYASASDPTSAKTIVSQPFIQTTSTFTNSTAPVSADQDAQWSFGLYDKAGVDGTYCIRVVRENGSTLYSYTSVPEITTIKRNFGGAGSSSPADTQCSDGIDNNGMNGIDAADPNCHLGGNANNPYLRSWDNESVAPADNSGGGGNGNGGGAIVLPQCSDGIDNNGINGIDSADLNCHQDGNINNPYLPNWDSESVPSVTNGGGGGQGGGGGDLGFFFNKIYSIFKWMPFNMNTNLLLGMAANIFS